jgi:2-polyprenyl-3-methyl-5-hydroxy-6-metoxy-1,4-benzoquinol methylase
MASRLQQISARLRKNRDSDAQVGSPGDGLERFAEELDSAISRNDKSSALGLIEQYRELVRRVEDAVSPPPDRRARPGRPLALGSGVQSQQFMIDLLPSIQAFLNLHPRGSTFDVLDVGGGTGHGSNLLASLYASTELGYRLRISTLDVNDVYELYIAAACRYVTFIRQDIFRLDRRYDIVIASHVIEHVREPLAFCRQLQRLSTGAVFIATPFKEPEEDRTAGHINSFDESFVEKLAPKSFQIIHSEAWGRFMDPPYEMLIAELSPLADHH